MYTKSYTFALLAIWLFNACLAAPSPDPKAEPSGAYCNPCTVERCHNIPITSHVPIKTTHRIIPSSNCGYGIGLGNYGGWGLGGWGGWNNGGWGGYGNGWNYGGWGNDCGSWGNGGWGGWSGNLGCGWGNSGWGGWGHGGWGGYGSCY